MTEPTAEIPQSTGIQLVSKEDNLIFEYPETDDSFTTPRKLIPSLGEVYLFGSRMFEHDEDQMGIAIIGDTITVGKARSFWDNGLYELEVKLRGLPQPSIPLACTLLIPQQNTALEGEFGFGEDKLATDTYYRYYGGVEEWKRANDDTLYTFFVPANPEVLSQLRFSFKSLPQETTLPDND